MVVDVPPIFDANPTAIASMALTFCGDNLISELSAWFLLKIEQINFNFIC